MSQTLPSPIAFPEPRRCPTYRFGLFELDSEARELRRSGLKLRVQEQPYQVLLKLLEKAGSIVTREELQSTLWTQDTFVDFDTSLNTAIKRLREVLGDSADVPVFVETIPRRGYRFIAPVVSSAQDFAGVPVLPQAQRDPDKRSPGRFRVFSVALAVATAGGAGVAWLLTPAPVPRIVDSLQLTFSGTSKSNVHRAAGQLFFNEQRGGQVALVQLPEAGGLLRVVETSPHNSYVGSVSPDGFRLLVGNPKAEHMQSDESIRVIDLPSSSVRKLNVQSGHDATWSPKGELLVSREEALYLSGPDGGERKLLSVPGEAYYLRYSPDGRVIRFTVWGTLGQSAIWEARNDGTRAHPILAGLNGAPRECCGEWTPDGRYFTFLSQRNGISKVWIRREASAFGKAGKPVQLTAEPLNFECAVPSEDGRKLFVCAGQPRAELDRFDAKNSEFVPYLGGASALDLERSPDGSAVVYVKYPERTLWIAAADGGNPVQLTGTSLEASLPHWSPDNEHIAFSGASPGQPWNVYLISSHGGPAEQLTHGPVADLDATWSPDGKKLAFAQVPGGKDQQFTVSMLDLASRQQSKLEGSEGMCCPRWSPDGRYLAGTTTHNQDIVLYDFTARKWTPVTERLAGIGYMAWGKDSKHLIFDTQWVKDAAFYRLRIDDRHLEVITGLNGVTRFVGSWGSWTGVAPDGTPLLVRDVGHQEIYALGWDLP